MRNRIGVAEQGRIEQVCASRIEDRHKGTAVVVDVLCLICGVIPSVIDPAGNDRSCSGRETVSVGVAPAGVVGISRDICLSFGIDGDRVNFGTVVRLASEIARIDEALAVWAELGQETIVWAIRIARTYSYITYGLERAFGDWKIGRVSISRHIGAAARIHGDSLAHFTNCTSQIRGIHQRRAGGVELAHEDGKEVAGFRYGDRKSTR